MRPLTLISAATAALTPATNRALIHAAGLGLSGAAVGTVALHALQTVLLAAAAAWHNWQCPAGTKPWVGLSTEAFAQVRSRARERVRVVVFEEYGKGFDTSLAV